MGKSRNYSSRKKFPTRNETRRPLNAIKTAQKHYTTKRQNKNKRNQIKSQKSEKSNNEERGGKGAVGLTETVVNEIIKGVAIAIVGEFVIGGGEFLEALKSNGIEIPAVLGILSENHGAASDESVDQRLLRHV